MAVRPTIALLTDFGLRDAYVGVMKSVILARCPNISFIDLSHEIEPQNIREAAYLTWSAYSFLPDGTVTMCVVDPGVGTERRALAVSCGRGSFVGPDNGWLTWVLDDTSVGRPGIDADPAPLPGGWQAVELTSPEYHLEPVSPTFHGRDIFAPAAAALASGIPIDRLGEPLDRVVTLALPPIRASAEDRGEVIHIDRFGNLITNISGDSLPDSFSLSVAGRDILGPATSYQSDDVCIALVGSSRLLEIAVPNGSAQRLLGASVGDMVEIAVGAGAPV